MRSYQVNFFATLSWEHASKLDSNISCIGMLSTPWLGLLYLVCKQALPWKVREALKWPSLTWYNAVRACHTAPFSETLVMPGFTGYNAVCACHAAPFSETSERPGFSVHCCMLKSCSIFLRDVGMYTQAHMALIPEDQHRQEITTLCMVFLHAWDNPIQFKCFIILDCGLLYNGAV